MATRDAAGAERSGTPERWRAAIRLHLVQRDYEVLAPLATSERVLVPRATHPFPDAPGEPLKDTLERIVAAEEDLARDIHTCVSSGRSGDWRAAARDPRQWVRGFVLALARAWKGFAPVWQAAQEPLAREIERVGVATARDAQLELLESLLPTARVSNERWELEGFADHDIGYGVPERGLVLIPLVAGSRASVVNHDEAVMSHIGYPLRSVQALTPAAPLGTGSLEALLGIPRARILRQLERPSTNSDLAEALLTVPSAATHHVTALEAAGLVSRARSGRCVLVRRTRRGEALLALYGTI